MEGRFGVATFREETDKDADIRRRSLLVLDPFFSSLLSSPFSWLPDDAVFVDDDEGDLTSLGRRPIRLQLLSEEDLGRAGSLVPGDTIWAASSWLDETPLTLEVVVSGV